MLMAVQGSKFKVQRFGVGTGFLSVGAACLLPQLRGKIEMGAISFARSPLLLGSQLRAPYYLTGVALSVDAN